MKKIAVLQKHINWIEEEYCNKSGDNMLFRVKYGVLKMQIKSAK